MRVSGSVRQLPVAGALVSETRHQVDGRDDDLVDALVTTDAASLVLMRPFPTVRINSFADNSLADASGVSVVGGCHGSTPA
jgi:hypothetical protein